MWLQQLYWEAEDKAKAEAEGAKWPRTTFVDGEVYLNAHDLQRYLLERPNIGTDPTP